MSVLGKWFGFERGEVFEEGVAAFDRGDYESAVEAFESCLAASKDASTERLAKFHLSQSHVRLAVLANRRSDNMVAAREIKTAIAISPGYPDLHLLAAKIFLVLGDTDGTIFHLERALALKESFADALIFQAAVLYQAGQEAEAFSKAEAATRMNPVLDIKRVSAAREFHQSGDRKRAKEELFSLASAMDEANLHRELGDSYMRSRDLEEAASAYRRALDISPSYADLHCRLGAVLIELGRMDEAEQSLRTALEINPNYSEAHARLGAALVAQEKLVAAESSFERAAELDPDLTAALRRGFRLR